MNNYILYGDKKSSKFYVANTNPILWTPEINKAKIYETINSARFSILRDWDNYDYMLGQINAGLLDNFYVAIVEDNVEKERIKLL